MNRPGISKGIYILWYTQIILLIPLSAFVHASSPFPPPNPIPPLIPHISLCNRSGTCITGAQLCSDISINTTGNITASDLTATGLVTFSELGQGVVHANSDGHLSSSLIVDGDIAEHTITGDKLASDISITTTGDITTTGTLSASEVTSGSISTALLTASDIIVLNLLQAPTIDVTDLTAQSIFANNITANNLIFDSEQISDLTVTGIATFTSLVPAGVVHTNNAGVLSSSLVVDTDIAQHTISGDKFRPDISFVTSGTIVAENLTATDLITGYTSSPADTDHIGIQLGYGLYGIGGTGGQQNTGIIIGGGGYGGGIGGSSGSGNIGIDIGNGAGGIGGLTGSANIGLRIGAGVTGIGGIGGSDNIGLQIGNGVYGIGGVSNNNIGLQIASGTQSTGIGNMGVGNVGLQIGVNTTYSAGIGSLGGSDNIGIQIGSIAAHNTGIQVGAQRDTGVSIHALSTIQGYSSSPGDSDFVGIDVGTGSHGVGGNGGINNIGINVGSGSDGIGGNQGVNNIGIDVGSGSGGIGGGSGIGNIGIRVANGDVGIGGAGSSDNIGIDVGSGFFGIGGNGGIHNTGIRIGYSQEGIGGTSGYGNVGVDIGTNRYGIGSQRGVNNIGLRIACATDSWGIGGLGGLGNSGIQIGTNSLFGIGGGGGSDNIGLQIGSVAVNNTGIQVGEPGDTGNSIVAYGPVLFGNSVTVSDFSTGVVHSNSSGLLSSSLITGSDLASDISFVTTGNVTVNDLDVTGTFTGTTASFISGSVSDLTVSNQFISQGITTISSDTTVTGFGTGVIHSNSDGLLSSSLIVDSDIASDTITGDKFAPNISFVTTGNVTVSDLDVTGTLTGTTASFTSGSVSDLTVTNQFISQGITTLSSDTTITGFGTGVIHSNSDGLLSSSLIVDSDIASDTITGDKLARNIVISTTGSITVDPATTPIVLIGTNTHKGIFIPLVATDNIGIDIGSVASNATGIQVGVQGNIGVSIHALGTIQGYSSSLGDSDFVGIAVGSGNYGIGSFGNGNIGVDIAGGHFGIGNFGSDNIGIRVADGLSGIGSNGFHNIGVDIASGQSSLGFEGTSNIGIRLASGLRGIGFGGSDNIGIDIASGINGLGFGGVGNIGIQVASGSEGLGYGGIRNIGIAVGNGPNGIGMHFGSDNIGILVGSVASDNVGIQVGAISDTGTSILTYGPVACQNLLTANNITVNPGGTLNTGANLNIENNISYDNDSAIFNYVYSDDPATDTVDIPSNTSLVLFTTNTPKTSNPSFTVVLPARISIPNGTFYTVAVYNGHSPSGSVTLSVKTADSALVEGPSGTLYNGSAVTASITLSNSNAFSARFIYYNNGGASNQWYLF